MERRALVGVLSVHGCSEGRDATRACPRCSDGQTRLPGSALCRHGGRPRSGSIRAELSRPASPGLAMAALRIRPRVRTGFPTCALDVDGGSTESVATEEVPGATTTILRSWVVHAQLEQTHHESRQPARKASPTTVRGTPIPLGAMWLGRVWWCGAPCSDGTLDCAGTAGGRKTSCCSGLRCCLTFEPRKVTPPAHPSSLGDASPHGRQVPSPPQNRPGSADTRNAWLDEGAPRRLRCSCSCARFALGFRPGPVLGTGAADPARHALHDSGIFELPRCATRRRKSLSRPNSSASGDRRPGAVPR